MSLPIVEEITALGSQADRADWLMRCPDWHFMGYVASIRAALETCGFPEAVAYLERRHVAHLSNRTDRGDLPHTVLMGLYHAESVMRDAARRRDGGAG